MFIEFKNLNVAYEKEFSLAVVYFNKCDGELFLKEQGIAKSGSYSCFSPLIAIVDYVPQKASCEIIFTDYRILNKEEEKDALDTLKGSNLTINDKGFISFLDLSRFALRSMGRYLPMMISVSTNHLRVRYSRQSLIMATLATAQNLLRVMPKSTPILLSELLKRLVIFGSIGEWVSDLIIFST